MCMEQIPVVLESLAFGDQPFNPTYDTLMRLKTAPTEEMAV